VLTRELDPLGHKYVDTVVDATYDAKGYTLHKCSVCGYSYKSDYTDILVLGYVKNLKVTRQNPKFITLEWSMSTDGSGYEVEQYKGGKWVRISKTDSSANCALTVTNLTPGTSYTFRVRLRKVSGSTVQYGGYIRAVATTVLPNVTTFTASQTTSRTITLKWDKNADATGYVVEQYKGGKWTQILKTTGNTTLQCTASSLAPETRYSFRMKSYKKTGNAVVYSDYTNIAATTRIACVSGLTAKSSTVSSVTLSWNKVASATGYVVEIYKGGKWNTVLTTKNNTALSCKVTGLAAGSTYKARIKCYRLANGAYSFSEYLEADVNTRIANVTGFKASGNTASSITFSWNKNTAATGYIVEIYKGGKWTQILNAKSNTTLTCTATGLSANATYSVRIKSFKKTTATTYFSDYLTFSADTRIPNVTSLTYKADSASQVTLSWSRNTAADGYTVEIYRGGKWEQVLCAASNTKLSCKITGLAEGSTYSVRIKSYKVKNGRTVFSEYLKSTATTGLNPVAKLGEQTNSTASSIRFSWARKSCATGYIVEIYKGGKWNLVTKTTSNTVTSCQITNLNSGTAYTCRVRAYLTVNGSTIYSDNVRTVQTTK
jgi:pyruvoyl-dependent arginine decarboxylase (PvlArgDC)